MEIEGNRMFLSFLLLVLFLMTYIKWEKEKVYFTAVLLFVFFVYGINEILSVYNILDKQHLFLVYSGMNLFFLLLIISGVLKNKDKIENINSVLRRNKTVWFKENKLFLIFVGLFAGIFILAFMTWPYNWDSLTYHLPRIAQWAQNKSVGHYAVNDTRQVSSPVLAEFINLHVYIFKRGKDNWLNLLQYTSFMTNSALIYFITGKLQNKKNSKTQWISVLLFVSMPIAFGEALSTQVDHFSTMFLLIYVFFILDILNKEHKLDLKKENILYVLILSACIGLGYLAKPSIMFAMIVFACWLLIICIQRKDKLSHLLILILLAAGIIVLLLAPEMLRNIITFGAISTPNVGSRQLVGTLKPTYLFINGLKNFAMNLPNIYLDISKLAIKGIYWIGYILGVNVDDSSISEDGLIFELHSPRKYGHDIAINPVIVIAMILAFIWLLVRKLKKEAWTIEDVYSVTSIVSFLIFCVVLRWEPFVTRYMLSYLALLCPMVAIGLRKVCNRDLKMILTTILVVICYTEMAGLFSYHFDICRNQNYKEENIRKYFQVRGDEWEYFQLDEQLDAIGGGKLGLYLGMNIYEYPIWYACDGQYEIHNVNVTNQTARFSKENFIPEYIVVIGRNGEDISNYQGQIYVEYKKMGEIITLWALQ